MKLSSVSFSLLLVAAVAALVLVNTDYLGGAEPSANQDLNSDSSADVMDSVQVLRQLRGNIDGEGSIEAVGSGNQAEPRHLGAYIDPDADELKVDTGAPRHLGAFIDPDSEELDSTVKQRVTIGEVIKDPLNYSNSSASGVQQHLGTVIADPVAWVSEQSSNKFSDQKIGDYKDPDDID